MFEVLLLFSDCVFLMDKYWNPYELIRKMMGSAYSIKKKKLSSLGRAIKKNTFCNLNKGKTNACEDESTIVKTRSMDVPLDWSKCLFY